MMMKQLMIALHITDDTAVSMNIWVSYHKLIDDAIGNCIDMHFCFTYF